MTDRRLRAALVFAALPAAAGAADEAVPARAALRVTLRQLSKRYGERLVLKGLDLDIAPGEFVAVVGQRA